ncbi:Hok/Gef family protein [Serratia oryzae]|uniref:Hok/Gef family protein n=1 Tax=Serratia oryzae TaxID=2034155 RepID=UPI0026C7ABD9
MLNKGDVVKLVVICATVISLVWITRSKICELRIRSGNIGGCSYSGLRIRTVRQPNGGS